MLTAWGFTTDEHHVPTDTELTALLESVGYERITLDGDTLTVPDGMQIDLGAVGKGYAGDLAAQELHNKGFRSSAQAVGGAVGHNPIAIIIPCHRVVGADGSLTGYAGGLDRKIRLLRLEQTDT